MKTLNSKVSQGLHTVVFQQRSLFSYLPTTFLPVRNALDRWHIAWEMRNEDIDHNGDRGSWQDIGFIGHASEYACLVRARLDVLEMPTLIGSNVIGGQVLKTAQSSDRLDDTSMSLVTDLMLSLTVAEP